MSFPQRIYPPTVAVDISVRMPFEELAKLAPEQSRAILEGIAEVIAANREREPEQNDAKGA